MSAASQAEKEKDVDELDGDWEDSDSEDTNEFRVRDPLNPPTANLFSTQALHTLIHEGLIDLNPAYQRDVVWPEAKQIHLIDSIFRNFYIPPVIFAVQRDEDGEEVRICVDGKQRLTSIQKFFDGQIPHRDSKTKKTYWFTRSEAQKGSRNDIPAHWKKQFADKQITCVEYHNLAPGTEREIFQRVQLGVTLTAAEKLQAIASPWAEWIGELEAQHVTSDGGLSTIIDWDTSRGRDFQCIAQLVYCCDGLPQQLLPTNQKLEKWLIRIDKPTPAFKTQINSVLSAFWYIASTKGLDKGFTEIGKRVAPVEFVFIGVLLFAMRDYSHQDRGQTILRMRLFIREKFKDVRNNTQVGKMLWTFIQSITQPGSVSLDDIMTSQAKPSKKKRKAGDDEDEDDDYKPSPIKTLGSAAKTRSKATKR
jgi:hypothetical protein